MTDLDQVPASALTFKQLTTEIARIEAVIDDGFDEHSGSPGEWYFERLEELELNRRTRMSKIEKPDDPENLFTQKQLDEAVAVAKAEGERRLQALIRDNNDLRNLLSQVALTGATLSALIQSQANRRTDS